MLIYNANVVCLNDLIEQGAVYIQNGRVNRILSHQELDSFLLKKPDLYSVNAGGAWLIPGFVDVHVHGGNGYDFMDATEESLLGISKFHAQHGTTSMLATTVTSSKDNIEKVLKSVASFQEEIQPFAQVIGVHLEGPFISPNMPGAQNPNYIVPPNVNWMKEWTEIYPNIVKILTLAPEADHAIEVIEYSLSQGIVIACGHSDGTYEEILRATEAGLTHSVHMYNAMRGFHHREPGVAGNILVNEGLSTEIIADGEHVHPVSIQLLTKLKNKDNLLLITDAMSAAGLGDGTYNLGGLEVVMKDNVARLKEGGNLAGSSLTMIEGFKYMVNTVGLSVSEASKLASYNPAKLLGLEYEVGSIREGYQADLLLLTKDLEIEKVWKRGELIEF
ncbi:N-acetylglucosamine-6-phosphate deacetylase [Chengkuizengella axinellae]|uniref:N-acetylglucosamine-6-phosphate deacetylase n=1 Tax=Chengkuizengella axinellae TaxID=3064388 RepID=A0ABT9IUB9_9BACL|nr:N-acetylglucosamine-6-phosphate deacetylase [Chengkuizengella sp. 2205SS18-9]MDP5272951.1 N-acetylglucosamine-6-phosphate deacetylase [Chengkuizengella sp. 2205SS18-9]